MRRCPLEFCHNSVSVEIISGGTDEKTRAAPAPAAAARRPRRPPPTPPRPQPRHNKPRNNAGTYFILNEVKFPGKVLQEHAYLASGLIPMHNSSRRFDEKTEKFAGTPRAAARPPPARDRRAARLR
ncbi:hypothetical protein EVAR_37142_1 [Eumeta japonica]|uniref:Uncharacterized protein n=1 Tax=Eumeta variegata TaxID=151549 RepID=A0A4C1WLJ1_EUMVA|nr:hypothetical protein EVAR_37142_1 [Eumeta japonica]